MKSGTLIRGMQLSYKGIHYIVVNKLSSGEYQLQNIKRGNFIPMSVLDVAHNMFTGDLRILVGDEKKHINDVDDINLLPDDAIKEAEKREIYVENALRDTFEERTRNGTLNTELIHPLPGTTRSNIAEKNEYNSKKHAGIKFSTLIKAIHIYIIDDYHQDFHEGIKDYPNEVWTLGAKKYEPRPFPKPEKLPSLMARIERRDLTNRGILFKYLRYNCDELIELFKEYGKIQVEFKFISSDMSKIYVVHPEKHTFIPTPALDQDYTKDLSLWQHQKAIDLNNEKRRRRNLEGIVKANKEIRDAVAHDIQEFSEYTAKMAKWKRIRQDNSTDGSGHSGQKKDEKEIAAKTVEKIPEKNARNPKKPNNESKSNTKRKTVNKPKKSQKPTLPQPPIPRRKAPIVAPSDIDGWSFDYRDRI